MYCFMCSREKINFFRQSNAVIHLFQFVRWFIYQVRNVTTFSCMVCTFHITCPCTSALKSLIVWSRMFILRCFMKKRRDPSTRRTDLRENVSDLRSERARLDSGIHIVYTYVHTCVLLTQNLVTNDNWMCSKS
jgi:hypothetical protein